jgi:tetratricopeptide (TPR) repeat protein
LRYDEAIRELRRGLIIEPNDPSVLFSLGFPLTGAGQFDDAIRTLEKAASLSDRSPAVLGVLARAYAGGGRRAEALQVVEELRRRAQKGYIPPAAFLNAYLGLGDKEQAFVWMERAAEERSNILQFLKVHPSSIRCAGTRDLLNIFAGRISHPERSPIIKSVRILLRSP